LAVLVLDPEVVADGDHLLAHLVAIAAPTTRSPELAIILALFTPVLSSAWHNHFSFSSLIEIWVTLLE
jgi:hypothetical protein